MFEFVKTTVFIYVSLKKCIHLLQFKQKICNNLLNEIEEMGVVFPREFKSAISMIAHDFHR